jgi:hypothetical protein
MSIFSDITSTTRAIENGVGGELDKIASNLGSLVVNFGTDLSKAMETQVTHLKTGATDAKADIEADFASFERHIVTLKNDAESAVEGVYNDFITESGKITDGIQKSVSKGVSSVEDASTYLRTKVQKDLTDAITSVRNEFDTIRSDFKTLIAGHANDFITFVKTETDAVVAGAKLDLGKVDAFKNKITGDISSSVGSVRNDLEVAKTKLKADLDKAVSFAKDEMVKIEGRLAKFAGDIKSASERIGVVIIIVAAVFFTTAIAYKTLSKPVCPNCSGEATAKSIK